MNPQDIEALISNEDTFRTYVVTTLQELKTTQAISEEKSAAINKRVDHIDKRVSKIERRYWIAVGVFAALFFILKVGLGIN